MSLSGEFYRLGLPFRRRLARLTCPRPSDMGLIGYEARIRERLVRWQGGDPHWSADLSPKLAGAEYVRKLGYAVPETYGIYDTLADVPLDTLPPRLVLKPQHSFSSKGVFLLRDGVEQITGQAATRDWLQREAGEQADRPYLAEELLVNFDGRTGAPLDYKFHCFGPRVAYCTVIERNTIKGSSDLNRYWYRTPDWKRLDVRTRWDVQPEKGVPPTPPYLDEMFAMASDLGRRLNVFMRIDLYATTRGPVFGEFTPYPARGRHTTPMADIWLGSMWRGRDGCDDPPVAADRQSELVAAQ